MVIVKKVLRTWDICIPSFINLMHVPEKEKKKESVKWLLRHPLYHHAFSISSLKNICSKIIDKHSPFRIINFRAKDTIWFNDKWKYPYQEKQETLAHLFNRIWWWTLSKALDRSSSKRRDILLLSILPNILLVFLGKVVSMERFGWKPCWFSDRRLSDSKKMKNRLAIIFSKYFL